MHLWLYNVFIHLVFLLTFPFFLLYSLSTGRHRAGLQERLGFLSELPEGKTPRIWLHAASVGEVQVARAVLPLLEERLPGAVFIISSMTEQGRAVARRQLGGSARCIFAPLDLPFATGRAIRAIRPTLYICLETELWPNLLRQLQRQGVKTVLLNGRISERSYGRYRIVKGLMRETLACFARISAIQDSDAERLVRLGALPARIEVNGNAKYDVSFAAPLEISARNRRRLGLRERQPVLMAGSTHEGEDLPLLGVFRQLKKILPDLIFLLGPRHLERLPAIEASLRAAGEDYERLSRLDHAPRRTDLVLIDTMGELAGLYSIATFVFCGGSLVPEGGHNIMEAAAWGKPVFYGPHMKDFADAKEMLEAAGAGFQVRSPEELTEAVRRLIANPEKYKEAALQAAQVADRQRGSARQQVRLALQALES